MRKPSNIGAGEPEEDRIRSAFSRNIWTFCFLVSRSSRLLVRDLRSKRSIVAQAEIMRRETLGKVQEIAEVLRGIDGVAEFDEKLFGMLVERIKVMNLVQVEFVLRSGTGVIETI